MTWRTLLAVPVLLAACADPPPMSEPIDAGTDARGSDAGEPEPIGDPLTWPLDQPGPFRVGYRTFERTYRPPGQSADRTIRIHVWYPTLDTSGTFPTYGVYRDRDAFTDATAAAPAHASGLYPLHAYSHGHRGFAGVSHFLHRRMASHGWVTVAPDHTGNTLFDNVDPRPIAIYYERSLDVAQAIDALGELDPSDPLAGRIDTSHVLLTGHSFGSHTVWSTAGGTFDVARIEAEACTADVPCTAEELDVFRAGLLDPRVVAAAPMAGVISTTFFGDTGHSSVEVPILAMSGGADPIGADEQFARVTGIGLTWVEVAGACHEFFGLGCGAGDAPGEQEAIVGTLVLALGRTHVLGDTAPATAGVLDGTIAVSDRVTLRVSE